MHQSLSFSFVSTLKGIMSNLSIYFLPPISSICWSILSQKAPDEMLQWPDGIVADAVPGGFGNKCTFWRASNSLHCNNFKVLSVRINQPIYRSTQCMFMAEHFSELRASSGDALYAPQQPPLICSFWEMCQSSRFFFWFRPKLKYSLFITLDKSKINTSIINTWIYH